VYRWRKRKEAEEEAWEGQAKRRGREIEEGRIGWIGWREGGSP